MDPYLDDQFVSRYLPFTRTGARIRLLTSDKKLSKLLPAVELFAKQHGAIVEVRESNALHGRFVIVDRRAAIQSDPSIKDGAVNADAVLLEIVDVLPEVIAKFEGHWSSGIVRR